VQKIQQSLFFSYSSPERFTILKVMGKTWEKEMKEKSKIPVFDIVIVFPPNFFGTNITLLGKKRFQANNIGITFQAVFEEPDNKDADEDSLVYKFGWCKGTIIGEYSDSNSLLKIISVTPIEFKHEKMPEWVDKGGDFYDISDWIDYCQRYEFVLSLSIIKWFNVTVKTSKEWIEERKVPKTFQEKKDNFEHKYKRDNIAEKLFP